MPGTKPTIQLTDTITEGANLAWENVTVEWLGEKGYQFGNTVDAPWVKGADGLVLWFESELTTDLENIWGNCGEVIGGSNQITKKMIINGQLYILRDGKVYNIVGAKVN